MSEEQPVAGQDEPLQISDELQLRAVSNLVRHRILRLLRDQPATITQVAARMGIAKGSASYHMRLLEKAGLVAVVRTRKVRGVTERYYARTSSRIRLPEPEQGAPNVVMRHALADLEAAPSGSPRLVRMHQARLSKDKYAEFTARLEALVEEISAASDPAEPPATLALAFFRPEEHA
ncbi:MULTISPECIES: helix-turn-helix domain-containing protein [unclassified Streptomyces]|uniref:ArsR/SmtB family transcription factor n=1 Tax=unclassified Streptomyces TaxID=2593676 RepID=UPI0036EF095D